MAEKGVSRISVSLPLELLRDFDETIKSIGYSDRSKAIRGAMRSFISESKLMHGEREVMAGVLVVVYDHQVKGLEETLTDIQHYFEQTVRSTMHIRLDERNCLEIIAVKGQAKDIQDLAKKLTAKTGIKQLKQAVITPI